jgi:hypothetical protein
MSAANHAAHHAMLVLKPSIERERDPATRNLALRRLRENIDRWISATEVYATPGELPPVDNSDLL